MQSPLIFFLLGTLLDRSVSTSSHYYFGNCRYHAKYPPEKRSLRDSVRDMNDIEDEDRVSVRARLAKEMGFTGLSPLHRLHKLYGFNVLEDMIFSIVVQMLAHYIKWDVVHCIKHHIFQNVKTIQLVKPMER